MHKKELREIYLSKRMALSEEDIEKLSISIANNTLKLPIWDKKIYHLFLPIQSKKEIDTQYLLSILQGKDKDIVLPKSDFVSLEMTHYLLTDNTLIKKNTYDIPEPQQGLSVSEKDIDVIFVPLLCFDKNGFRVGYGKGFYDRFLDRCKEECIKIGLSFFEPIPSITDIHNKDRKIDHVVTPFTIFDF